MLVTPVHLLAFTVEPLVDAVTFAIQMPFSAVTLAVESIREAVFARGVGAI